MVLKVTLTWHWKLNIILFSDFRESHSQDGMQYSVQLGISKEVKIKSFFAVESSSWAYFEDIFLLIKNLVLK